MSIKPIDYHLSFNNTIYESKEKQNDFNKIRDTNTFLQHDHKNKIDRDMKRIQQSKESEGKKINRENKQNRDSGKNSKDHSKRQNSKKLLNNPNDENKTSNNYMTKGHKLDIFI